jgi:MFS family permease
MEDSQRKGIMKVVFLTIFIDLVGFSIIFPLFPEMLEYYFGNDATGWMRSIRVAIMSFLPPDEGSSHHFLAIVFFGGLLGSLYSFLQFLFAPVWGHFSDIYGRRKIMLITVTGIFFSYVIWFFSKSFEALLVARILGGIMSGNLSAATAAVADITTRKKRASGMAIVGIAFGLGFMVGPAIGGLSAQINLLDYNPDLAKIGINPFSFPALVSAGLAGLNLIWIITKFPETLPPEKRKPSEASRIVYPVFGIMEQPHAGVQRSVLLYLVFMLAFSGMEFTLTFLAVERLQFTSLENGLMFVLIGFVLMMIQGGIVRRMAPKIGEKKLMLTGFLIAVPSFWILAISQNLTFFLLGIIGMATAVALVSPTISSLISLYSDEREQGLNLGCMRSAGSFARAVGPIVAALVYFRYGSEFSYGMGAILMLIPFFLGLSLPAPIKDR